jgi:hypothetical protein
MCRAAPIVYVRMSPARSSCQEATKYGASPGSMATYAARIRFIPMMNVVVDARIVYADTGKGSEH